MMVYWLINAEGRGASAEAAISKSLINHQRGKPLGTLLLQYGHDFLNAAWPVLTPFQ